MPEENFNIITEGYWREKNCQYIPNYNGIYFVYLAAYEEKDDTIHPQTLVYIGQAAKVREAIDGRIATDNPWLQFRKENYEFCFSTACIPKPNTERVLSAFVYRYKPPANTDYVTYFTYEPTTITVTGKTALLESQFTVEK